MGTRPKTSLRNFCQRSTWASRTVTWSRLWTCYNPHEIELQCVENGARQLNNLTYPTVRKRRTVFKSALLISQQGIHWNYLPLRMPVTTRMIPFLVGNPNLNLHLWLLLHGGSTEGIHHTSTRKVVSFNCSSPLRSRAAGTFWRACADRLKICQPQPQQQVTRTRICHNRKYRHKQQIIRKQNKTSKKVQHVQRVLQSPPPPCFV